MPKYWLNWIGLGLFRAVIFLPHRLRLGLGWTLGLMMYALLSRRRAITALNIDLCFPGYTPSQRKQLVRAHFTSMGMGLIEMGMAWWSPDRVLKPLLHITGREHLEAAESGGRGILLLSAHFASLELGGRFLSGLVPIYFMYRPQRNELMDYIVVQARESAIGHSIARDNTRQLIKLLKQGKTVWYASDQNYGHKNSVFAPFFGVQAATNTAVSRIVEMTDACVLPFFVRRISISKGYELIFMPPLANFPSDDYQADAETVNQCIEKAVQSAPEQYFWSHRRFKDRPEGEPPLY